MSRLIELREAQARILTHMRGVLDTITDKSTETEVREKEAEYGKAEVDFDALQARIDREEKLEARSAIVARPVAERPDADEVRQVGRAIEAAKVDEKELFRRWVSSAPRASTSTRSAPSPSSAPRPRPPRVAATRSRRASAARSRSPCWPSGRCSTLA